MKRKLLDKKTIKTLKSLQKNISQKYNGVVKNIKKKEKKLSQIKNDLTKIKKIILEKETTEKTK